MSDEEFTIPFERLPPGFAETLDNIPAEPAPARPAATILLLRDAPGGVETLMLRRTRRSGFVPGAWVFAGGRVDGADGDAATALILEGLTGSAAARRLGLGEDAPVPATAFYLAGIREAFEETGILIGAGEDGGAVPGAAHDPGIETLRSRLLADEITLADVVTHTGLTIPAGSVEYIAHWITPVQEPRRYDTRFFAARVEPETNFALHESEMSEGRWLTPAAALEAHADGQLPMVFPTIRTLQSLVDFATADSVLDAFRVQTIPPILPRLVKTPTGVGLQIP